MNAELGQNHESGVGALLRASRLRCGEELRDVATLLCIRYPFLEAIEEGRYSDLPGSAYAVGFVRTYAEHLGLDSKEVVRRFKAEAENLERKTNLVFPVPIAERSTPGGAIVFVGILLASVAYGAWYVGTSKNSFLVDLVSPLPNRLSALVHNDGETAGAPVAVSPDTAAAKPTTAETGSPGRTSGEPAATVAEAVPEAVAPQKVPAALPKPAITPTSTDAAAPADTPATAAGNLGGMTPQPAVPPTVTVAAAPPAKPVASPKPTSVPTAPADGVSVPATASAPTVTAAVPAEPPRPVAPAMRAEPVTAKPPVTPPAKPKPVQPATPALADTAVAAPETPQTGAATPAPVVENPPASPVVPAPAASPVVESPAPAAPVAAAIPPSVGARANVTATPPVADAVQLPSAQVAAIPAAPDVASSAVPQGQPEAAGALSKASRIVVRAKLDSWIQVRDGAARRLLVTRLLRAGDTYRVPDQPNLTLLTGNAGALEIMVDGEAVPSIGGVGMVRRDVVLDADKLKAGNAVID